MCEAIKICGNFIKINDFSKIGSITIGIMGLIMNFLKFVFFTRHLINATPSEKEMFTNLTHYNWLIDPFILLPEIDKWFPVFIILESIMHGLVCFLLLIGKFLLKYKYSYHSNVLYTVSKEN